MKNRIIEQSKAGTSSETERAFFGRVMADSGAFILLPQNNERVKKGPTPQASLKS